MTISPFLLAIVSMLFCARLDPWLLIISGAATLATGLRIALRMAAHRHFYCFACLAFHLSVTYTVVYVMLKRSDVLWVREFDFSVFHGDNLLVALDVMGTALLSVASVWGLLNRKRHLRAYGHAGTIKQFIGDAARIRNYWLWLLLALSFLSGLVILATNASVFELPYPRNKENHWVPMKLLGFPVMAALFALATAHTKRLLGYTIPRVMIRLARYNVLVTPTLILCVAGNRGVATFAWALAGLLEIYILVRTRARFNFWGLSFLAWSFLSLKTWTYLRTELSSTPLDEALGTAVQLAIPLLGTVNTDTRISGIDLNDLWAGQMLFQLLYVIELVQRGDSLGGSTFVNLVPQMLPDFLDGVLWEKPLNDNWRLGDYFLHFGGFLVTANAYWNGGIVASSLFTMILTWILWGFDRYLLWRHSGTLYKTFYWLWLPVMFIQLAYGIQGEARILEMLGCVLLIDYWRGRRRVAAVRYSPVARSS